jgi:hypothetical protein
MVVIFRTDDTDAHGKRFIRAIVNNPRKRQFSKILFSINYGEIVIPFTHENNFAEERIELVINFSSKETSKLRSYNTGHVVTYDMNGKQKTCREYLEFESTGDVLRKWRK